MTPGSAHPAKWPFGGVAAPRGLERRLARKGCHAISLSQNLEELGFPSWHNPSWDPLWRACSEEGTVVCIHIGSGGARLVHPIGSWLP